MDDKNLMTQEGYDKLQAEHDYLASTRRSEVSQHLKEAKSYGDLSENAEYDAAKDEQAELEARIAQLETMLRNAVIQDEKDARGDKVALTLNVRLKDQKSKEEFVYEIVGASDADPFNNKISNDSPVGKALMGQKKGAKVSVKLDDGSILEYKILEIFK